MEYIKLIFILSFIWPRLLHATTLDCNAYLCFLKVLTLPTFTHVWQILHFDVFISVLIIINLFPLTIHGMFLKNSLQKPHLFVKHFLQLTPNCSLQNSQYVFHQTSYISSHCKNCCKVHKRSSFDSWAFN